MSRSYSELFQSTAADFSAHYDVAGTFIPPLPVADSGLSEHAVGGGLPGRHLIAEFYGASALADMGRIESGFRDAIIQSRATLLHLHFHRFGSGGGITGAAILAESHMTVHTWPEKSFCAIDIFMCGVCDPRSCLPAMVRVFSPRRIEIIQIMRGLCVCDVGAECSS
ncbi:adenosylmethionine decarboxylase [Phyllobacterium brassicacearum]